MAHKTLHLRHLWLMLILITFLGTITLTSQKSLAADNAYAHTRTSNKANEKRSNMTSKSSSRSNDAHTARNTENSTKGMSYFQAPLPMRAFECLRDFSLLRCTKLFMLLKMEERKTLVNTGHLTSDFLQQFFDSADDKLRSLIHNKYANMTDDKLNKCLIQKFQKFFKHRDIKLNLLPGVLVKIVPSRSNKLSFMLKKGKTAQKADVATGRASKKFTEEIDDSLTGDDESEAQSEEDANTKHSELAFGGIDGVGSINGVGIGGIGKVGGGGGGGGGYGGGEHGGGGKRGKKKKGSNHSSYKNTILQMAVPVMVMPAILMGTVLPFLLPVLKMATIMSMVLNNSAFIAALIYAARTHANAQEEQHISYPPQGYY